MIKIIGSGIGGLVAAITLAVRRPNDNNYFEIYEKQGNIDRVGGTITLFPNAIRILKNLGCLEDLYEEGWIVNNVRFTDTELNLIVVREIGNKHKYGEDTIAIRRKNLVKILLRRLRSLKKDVRFNENYVINEFNEHQNGNFLIIADGSKSPNRNLIDHKFTRKFQGMIYYGGYLNCDIEFLNQIRKYFHIVKFNQTVILNKNSFIGLSLFKNENNEIGIYWYTYIYQKNPLNKRRIIEIVDENDCKQVFAFHSNLNNLIIQMISKTNELIVSNIYETIPNNNCFSKNYIFIGDAAHNINPLSGQGAGMAIEDAYAYSLILSRENNNKQVDDLKKVYHMRTLRALRIQARTKRTSKLINIKLPKFLQKIRNKIYMIITLIVPNNSKNFDFFYDTERELEKLEITF